LNFQQRKRLAEGSPKLRLDERIDVEVNGLEPGGPRLEEE
jgi:hypothetical protein